MTTPIQTSQPTPRQIHLDQLKRVELFNGRAAMLGLVPLVDGYAACRTQFLPFCF